VYFTDWSSGEVTRFEATRIACGSVCGLGQGMFFGLYTRSTQCMCIRPAISGVSAYSSDGRTIDGEPDESSHPLETGPTKAPESAGAPEGDDWPMYRRDTRRGSAAACKVPEALSVAWTTPALPTAAGAGSGKLLRTDWLLNKVTGDAITQPTVAAGKVFVSLPHVQQVVALNEKDGQVAWRFHAPARVEAPPTIYRGLCLIGCNDGWVYCLRADDGRRVWRFRAAPTARRIVAYGQVESAWPVAGGVLMVDRTAYVVAGRTSEADGGLHVHALEPATGKCLWTARRVKPDDGPIGAWNLRSVRNSYAGPADLLCSDGKTVAIAAHRAGRFECESGKNISTGAIAGPRLGLMRSRYAADNQRAQYPPVAFCPTHVVRITRTRDRKTRRISRQITMTGTTKWQVPLPSSAGRVESLALAAETVLAAVSKGSDEGEAWVLSAADGKRLGTCKLPGAPAFDGLAVGAPSGSSGRAYLALQDGSVVCLRKK
jgi:outer membrane protein assembly factor BamB